MKLTRILSGIIGLPIVALILIFGNIFVIDIFMLLVALIAIYEYMDGFKEKCKPVTWIGYLACIPIAFLHLIPNTYYLYTIGLWITLIISVLFIQVVITNMKTTIKDIMVTFFGIIYIVFFLSFISLLYGMNNGKYLIWYILIAAWGTDTFAYFVGSAIGKHKFSKISPNKSIEGSIGGTIGAVLISLVYTYCINKFGNLDISYLYIGIITFILSVLSQIGDLSASAIKRTVEIKDFGSIIPGHGGILDRIDSIIFIAPVIYFLLMLV